MKIEELINKKISSKQIDSISNQEYKNICSLNGKREVDEIFREYAETEKSVYDICVI